MIYCIVPAELAVKLHERLREHFADEPGVEAIVERRQAERRAAERRREEGERAANAEERRRIPDPSGRRMADRRARTATPAALPELPRWARRHARRLRFIERRQPTTQRAEDLDTARIVARVQAGERDAFADIYLRFYERIYGYARSLLHDSHAAEDIAQQTFVRALEGLRRYKRGEQPFRAWLFTIARNEALMHVRKQERVEVTDPAVLDRVMEESAEPQVDMGIADLGAVAEIGGLPFENGVLAEELARLTPDQRQAILLIFGSGLSPAEAANVMHRSTQAVRALQHRALRELEQRMSARTPAGAEAGEREAAAAEPAPREPKPRKRDPMRIRFRPAPVTRERRYSNMGYGRPPGFDRQSENPYR